MNRILRIDEEKPEMHITVQVYKVTLCFAEKENPEVPDVEKVLEEMDNDPKGDNCYDKYNLWNKAKDYQCSFRPDLFCYNIGNLSGSFFLINDSIVTTASVPIAGCINNNTHRLVSPDGNVYIFNASETTTISSSHVKMPPLYLNILHFEHYFSQRHRHYQI